MGAIAASARGDTRRYELRLLGSLPSLEGGQSRAYAINDRGEIVGEAEFDTNLWHAVVWLYCPRFDLDAQVLHDLADLADDEGDGVASGAYDINEAGIVVGDALDDSARWPAIWRLPDYPTDWTTTLEPFDPSSGAGRANAINDGDPPVIVGSADIDETCGFFFPRTPVAFKYTVGDTDTSLDEDNLIGGMFEDYRTVAWDVITTDPVLAGGSIVSCQNQNSDPCEPWRSAAQWELDPDESTSLDDAGVDWGAEVFGMADEGYLVGWYRTDDQTCQQHAAFWEDVLAVLVDLGVVGLDEVEQTWANAVAVMIADGSIAVVGRAVFADSAILWLRNGSWSSVNLNAEVSPLCGAGLVEAFDVNAAGWIVGVASVGSEDQGFLLRPLACFGDVNADCVVDSSDLGLLLAGWSCGACGCALDMNLDGQIDSSDLGLLLANWECSCDEPCEGGGESAMAASEGAGDLAEDALSQLGFASVASFNEWRQSASSEAEAGALESLWAILSSELGL